MRLLKRTAHQVHQKYFEKHRNDKVSVKKVDKTMAVVGTFGPAMTSIQIFHIFSTKTVAGISPVAWGGYSVVALCWAVYGFFHKDKPLVIVNSISVCTSTAVLIGYMIFS